MDYKYKKISGIYKISTKLNDRIYVGSAVSLYNRYMTHKADFRHNRHCNKKLQRFVNKYGFSNLVFSVVEVCDNDNLIKLEQKYIDKLKPFYNICLIAGSTIGFKASKKTKQHFSNIRKGVQTTGMLGKKHKKETIEIIRKKAKLRGLSKSFMEASRKANTGRKHTPEMRENIAQKQRKISGEQMKEIVKLLSYSIYQVEIAKMYNVSQRVISKINLGIYL